MSHFSVAVITDGRRTIEELLAPYDESLRVAPYVRRTKEQIIRDAKEGKEKVLKRIADNPNTPVDEYMRMYLNAETDEELYECQVYDDTYYNERGDELSTYNPNSKWDYYEIGGGHGKALSM